MFRVGQKVVCVDATRGRGWFCQWLEQNKIYTIKSFAVGSDGGPGVHLEEVKRLNQHKPFALRRFRPVVERKTSIEVFKKLLNPTPQKVLEVQAFESHSECAGRDA